MRPTNEDDEALELLVKRDDLTEWEEGLLASLAQGDPEAHPWTEKQGATFDALWARRMEGAR